MHDQGSEGLLSPFLRERRIKAAMPHIAGRVLDVGCGVGRLADFIPAERYLGVDVDTESLAAARLKHPHHNFLSEFPPAGSLFNSVAALSVIEHSPDPFQFLEELSERLFSGPGSRIICTTPHPGTGRIHTAGASIGLFSRQAREEHQQLLGHEKIKELAGACGLSITCYRRFLFRANQLFILQRR